MYICHWHPWLSGYSIGDRKAVDLGSTPSECHIFYLFRCILSSVLPMRSVGRSNVDKGRHNLITLIHKSDIYQRTDELYNGINSGQLTKKSLSNNMSGIEGPHEGKATE